MGMEFLKWAKVLIPELKGLPFTVFGEDAQAPDAFQRKNCFLPGVQPLFTGAGLRDFFTHRDGKHIYTLQDPLDIRACLLKVKDVWVVLGPYVTQGWSEIPGRVRIARNGGQDARVTPYMLYYSLHPLLAEDDVLHIASLVLRYAADTDRMPPVEKLHFTEDDVEGMYMRTAEQYNQAELINERYRLEQDFVSAIAQGDAERALQDMKQMFSVAPALHYVTGEMTEYVAGAATFRTLIRHGGMQAGLSPVRIDTISQIYAQKMRYVTSSNELYSLVRECINEFCRTIRTETRGGMSPYVKRTLDYIDSNLSRTITMEELCDINGIGRAHLAHLFSDDTGMTIKQYTARKRCERAAVLLLSSDISIQEISRYIGYEDNNYFAKVFRAQMGQSPQEFRKSKKVN